jgi:hypothetical protein
VAAITVLLFASLTFPTSISNAQSDQTLNGPYASYLAASGLRQLSRLDGDLVGDGGIESIVTASVEGCSPCNQQRVLVFMNSAPAFDSVFSNPIVRLSPSDGAGFEVDELTSRNVPIPHWFFYDPGSATFVESNPPAHMNPPTPTPTSTYQTRNGPKTADQLRGELAAAGYSGPWDAPSMLAAYAGAAAAPTATPVLSATPAPQPGVSVNVPGAGDQASEPTASATAQPSTLSSPGTPRAAWQRVSDPRCSTPGAASSPFCQWLATRRHLLTDLVVIGPSGAPLTLHAGDDVELGAVSSVAGQPMAKLSTASMGGFGAVYLSMATVQSLDGRA